MHFLFAGYKIPVMVNNPWNDKCHKMLIWVDESTVLCPVCQDMGLYLVLYTHYRKFLLINEPTWKGHQIDDKYHEFICWWDNLTSHKPFQNVGHNVRNIEGGGIVYITCELITYKTKYTLKNNERTHFYHWK